MEYRALYPLIAGIAKALGHGRHGRGHRNLTPHNVFVTRDGTPKVSDFGLAAILPPAERIAHAEHAGTLHYLAPETRRDPRSVDARADVFALGVLTYELATATRLDGTARRAGPVAKTPRANEAFERLIARATDPDPSRRPPNADAFAFELARAFQSAPSRSPSAPTEDARPSRPQLTPPVERVIDSPRAEAAAAYERGDLVEAARIAEAALGDGAVDTEMELVAARAEAYLKERADQRAKLLEVHRERAREREAAGDPRGAADHLRRLLALDPSAEERAGIGARLAAIAGSAPPRRTRWPQVVALSSGAAILIAAAMLYYFVFAR
ncbi:MAG: protein kinase [Myxococcales bacterium]|nr:protein kinase [Myxococcales bacterium]